MAWQVGGAEELGPGVLLPWLGDRPPWEQGTWNDAPNERQHEEEEEETKGALFWVWVCASVA